MFLYVWNVVVLIEPLIRKCTGKILKKKTPAALKKRMIRVKYISD